MELPINSVLERVDDFLFERESKRFRVASGLEKPFSLAELHAEFPELSNPDVLASIWERLDNPRADETRKARLKRLYAFLVSTGLDARTAQAQDAMERALFETRFVAAAKSWSLADALRELPKLASKDARDVLEREVAAQLDNHHGRWNARTDALFASVAPLKHPSATALVETAQARPFARSLLLAKELLAATADAYQDLLAFGLKRVDPTLKPSLARLHDAERAAQGPWLLELLRREDLEHAVTRCLGDLNLPSNANGRIAVEAESRPGRWPGAHVFVLHVPDQVRVVLTPDAGLETYAAWLGAWGVAQHRAGAQRALPFVERALGDLSVPAAVGHLVESFLLEEGWLKRYVRLTSSQAREVARVAAFRQTFQARREAALVLCSHALLERGPGAAVADEYVERLQDALRVQVPKGRWAHDVDPTAPEMLALDARALEGLWHQSLRERFNEDYWRNPATGRWLLDQAQNAQRDDAMAIAALLGHEALSAGPAARRRVAVMGA